MITKGSLLLIMKYKLAIFDMDGTILNTLDDLAISLNYALRNVGFPERTISEVKSFVGNGIHRLIELGVPADTSVAETEKVYQLFIEHYTVHCTDNTRPYDGIQKALKEIKDAGILTAVVSNKADYAVQDLCLEFFDGLFDYAIGEKEDLRKKPSPDAVYEVLTNLNIEKSDAVYIGDSEVDIQTAQNSGLDCITVAWGFREIDSLLASGATTIISDPNELLYNIL